MQEHPRSAAETESTLAESGAAATCFAAQEKCPDGDDCSDLCEWHLLLGRGAAECIAMANGFGGGAKSLIGLGYDQDWRAPVWHFQGSHPTRDGDRYSESTVEMLTLHAETGALLGRDFWSEKP